MHIIFSCTEIQGTTPGEGVVLMPSSLRWSFCSYGSQTRQLPVLTTYNLSCWTTWMELARLPWPRKTLQTFPRWFESNHLAFGSSLLTLLLPGENDKWNAGKEFFLFCLLGGNLTIWSTYFWLQKFLDLHCQDFTDGEEVKKLECDHCFHSGCIVPWLELHGTCPVCRKELGRSPASGFFFLLFHMDLRILQLPCFSGSQRASTPDPVPPHLDEATGGAPAPPPPADAEGGVWKGANGIPQYSIIILNFVQELQIIHKGELQSLSVALEDSQDLSSLHLTR